MLALYILMTWYSMSLLTSVSIQVAVRALKGNERRGGREEWW